MKITSYIFIFLCLLSTKAMAHGIAEIDSFDGIVKVYDSKSETEKQVRDKGYQLQAGDRIIVSDDAWARLTYRDGSVVLLKEKCELNIDKEKTVTLARGRASSGC